MQHSGQTPCFGGGGGGGTINVALYVAGSAAGSAGIACPAFCFVIFFPAAFENDPATPAGGAAGVAGSAAGSASIACPTGIT